MPARTALLGFATLALMALAVANAQAALVLTTINARVSSISGAQSPSQLAVGDVVTMAYEYDDAGIEANIYYLDGRIFTTGVAPDGNHSEPWLAVSDSKPTFSPNLVHTFNEFTGTSGFQLFNLEWAFTDVRGFRYFYSYISPSVVIPLGYDPSGATPVQNMTANILLWQAEQTGVTTVSVNFTSLDSELIVPEPSTITLISMALVSLFGFGLMRHRQAY